MATTKKVSQSKSQGKRAAKAPAEVLRDAKAEEETRAQAALDNAEQKVGIASRSILRACDQVGEVIAALHDRHCEEVGTFKDCAATAIAPNADVEDAPGIVIDALDQLSTDLFMLS